MDVLAQESWTWTLYGDGDRRVLAVFTGGVGMWELALELTTDEIAAWEAQGIEGLRHLVRGIQQTPDAFLHRRVPVPS